MLYNAYSKKVATRARSKKKALSYLNIMLVGPNGTGKTGFMRTFYESIKKDVVQGTFKESKLMSLKEPIQPTTDMYSISLHINDNGERTALTLIDTPGFNAGSADVRLRYISKYINRQFERTLAEESKVKRDAKAIDTHIHACIYFIDPTNLNGLSNDDLRMIKALSSKVNVIPVIGKADTLTIEQREHLKVVVRREIFDRYHVPIYGYLEPEEEDTTSTTNHLDNMLDMLNKYAVEDDDTDARAVMEYVNCLPFTLISFEEDLTTGRPIQLTGQDGNPILGRRFPWAVVECINTNHSNFDMMKATLLSVHRDMLRIDTFERFYEKYRTEQLLKDKMDHVMTVETREEMVLV